MKDFHPQQLLAGVDLTPASNRALAAAAAWARHYQARLAAVLVARSDTPWEFTAGQIAAVRTEGRSERDSLRRRLEHFVQPAGGAAEIAAEVVEGHPETALAEAAARWQAELLVFGLHRRSQTSGLGVEGLPFELMHRTRLPLLAVPEAGPLAEPAGPRRVLAFLRSGGEPGRALDAATAIAQSWGAPLAILAPCAASGAAAPDAAHWERQCLDRVAALSGGGEPRISLRPNLRPEDVAQAARAPGSLLVLESERAGRHHWFHPEPAWETMLRALPIPALLLPGAPG